MTDDSALPCSVKGCGKTPTRLVAVAYIGRKDAYRSVIDPAPPQKPIRLCEDHVRVYERMGKP